MTTSTERLDMTTRHKIIWVATMAILTLAYFAGGPSAHPPKHPASLTRPTAQARIAPEPKAAPARPITPMTTAEALRIAPAAPRPTPAPAPIAPKATAAPASAPTAPPTTIAHRPAEDDPDWDCALHGNGVCGRTALDLGGMKIIAPNGVFAATRIFTPPNAYPGWHCADGPSPLTGVIMPLTCTKLQTHLPAHLEGDYAARMHAIGCAEGDEPFNC